MIWLYRFIRGYLTLEFSGEFSERILNLCAKNHIVLWNLHYKKQKITGCIVVSDFKRLRKIRKGKKISIHIIGKHGIPFVIKKYKKRVGFFIGIILFFIILQYLSGFVWSVEVVGNKNISKDTIINECKKIGVYEGIKSKGFDSRQKREELLSASEDLAWASMNIEGCKLTVNVTEIKKKTVENDDMPTNLKSSADGIIKKIDITSGNAVVKVGDTVCKGDVIVSGIIEGLNSTQFVHSLGSVTAITEREIVANADYIQTRSIENGKSKTKSVLSLFHIKIPLYLGTIQNRYISETKTKRPLLFKNKLPVGITTKTFKFVNDKDIEYSKYQLEEQLETDIKNQILKLGIENYEVKDTNIEQTETGIKKTVIISAEENIAYQDILLFNSGN